MDITAGSGGVSAEDEDGGRQDGWLGTTLGTEAGFVAGDLGSEIVFGRAVGRGSSGGSADPNETLGAAEKDQPSSTEASPAGHAKEKKRIRFDRQPGELLTLCLGVSIHSGGAGGGGGGGGGGCQRIVKLQPGEMRASYVGSEPLASMIISSDVSVSDSAISAQVAANLEASISVLQQLCSWKKSYWQRFLDGACGALKARGDVHPPCQMGLVPRSHRPKASDGALEPRRREYVHIWYLQITSSTERS